MRTKFMKGVMVSLDWDSMGPNKSLYKLLYTFWAKECTQIWVKKWVADF